LEGEEPTRGGGGPFDADDEAAAKAAARAAPGKNPGEGWPGKNAGGGPGGAGPRRPLNIIMALAFSAAAAAAMRLLFSASDKRGERRRKVGSMQGEGNPKESLK
jgi:hypothetical protein